MEKPNYQCYNCRNFLRYFIKKKTKFEKTKFGCCIEKGENVDVHGKCERFKLKQMICGTDTMHQRKLDRLLTEISALRTILEEETCEYAESKKL